MTSSTYLTQNLRFKVGWLIVLITAVLMSLNHLVLIFVLDDPTLFVGYAAFNLYACLVILIPFRRGEKWAWYTTWILPVGLAIPAFIASDSTITIFYLVVTVASAIGLLLTLPNFFSKHKQAPH